MATYNINKIITPSGDICNLNIPGSKIWTADSMSGSSPTFTVTTRTGDFVKGIGNILILELGSTGIAGDTSVTINVDNSGACQVINPSGETIAQTDVVLAMLTLSVFQVIGYLNYETIPGRGLSWQDVNYGSKKKTLFNESPAWYCTCATETGTAAKVLTSLNGDYSNPTDGDIITVRFTNGDAGPTQTTTFNIDGSGAYGMNRGDLAGPIWGNGGHQTFVFRGSKWYTVDVHQGDASKLGVVMLSNSADSSLGTTSGYAATPKAVADAQTASRTMDAGANITWNLDTGETVALRRMGSSGSYGFGLAYSDGTNTKLNSLIDANGDRNWVIASELPTVTSGTVSLPSNATTVTSSATSLGSFTAGPGLVNMAIQVNFPNNTTAGYRKVYINNTTNGSNSTVANITSGAQTFVQTSFTEYTATQKTYTIYAQSNTSLSVASGGVRGTWTCISGLQT